MIIRFDYWPSQISWNLNQTKDNLGNDVNILLLDGSGQDGDTLKEQSICVDTNFNTCFQLNLFDSASNGFQGVVDDGWFEVSSNGSVISLEKQSFHGNSSVLYFCNKLLLTSTNDNNNNNSNILEFLLSRMSDSDTFHVVLNDTSNNILYNNYYQAPSFLEPITSSASLSLNDGCYGLLIEPLSDSSDKETNAYYEILFNSELVTWFGSKFSSGEDYVWYVNNSAQYWTTFCTNNATSSSFYWDFNNSIYETEYESVDYYFQVGLDHVFTDNEYFGCTTPGCTVAKTWQINGTCLNPRLTVWIAEGDYDNSYETAMIYINNDYVGDCNELGQWDCGDIVDNFVECETNGVDLDLSDYLSNNEFLTITVRISQFVDFCPFDGVYYLFVNAIISCDFPANYTTPAPENSTGDYTALCEELNHNISDLVNDVTLNIQLDYAASDVSWIIVDDADNSVKLNGSGSYHSNLDFIEETVCASQSDCISVTLYDKQENGLSAGIGWFEVLLNGDLVTKQKQVFDDSQMTVSFCVSLFDNFNNSRSGGEPKHDLNVSINYDTIIEIANISDTQVESVLYRSKLVHDITSTNSDTRDLNLRIADGCYQILFYDSSVAVDTDTIDTFENAEAVSDSVGIIEYGRYEIIIDDDSVAFGGYYSESESNIVCTDDNHISFCIIPYHCENNNNIFMTDFEFSENFDTMFALSHKSLVNISYTQSLGSNSEEMSCLGTYSCIDSEFALLRLNCFGVYSCQNSILFGNSKDSEFIANCYGTASCHGIQTVNETLLNLLAVSALKTPISSFELLLPRAMFSLNDIRISNQFSGSAILFAIDSYSMYNVTIECNSDTTLWVRCDDPREVQYAIIGDTCQYPVIDDACNFVNSSEEIDAVIVRVHDDLMQLINDHIFNDVSFGTQCLNNSLSLDFVFDIGYSFNIGQSIINQNQYGNICCLGHRSCALTDTITTKLGDIFCVAYQSCVDSTLIWADSSVADEYNEEDQANIFCLANLACSGSILDSGNNIICSAWYSCKDAAILNGETLYCSKWACLSAIIRKISVIYFLDAQVEAIVYSGYIGTSEIYFRGIEAGYGVTYYCDEGDECLIDCGQYACNRNETLLYCDGKCTVRCYGSNDDEEKDCVSIILSMAPTTAPSITPTMAPTKEIFVLFTQENVSLWFNWILACGGIMAFLLIIVGVADARKWRPNELFQYKAVIVTAFYSSDFISDIFFCIKLSISAYSDDNVNRYKDSYAILFWSSLVFIVIPLCVNITQLHMALTSWTNDTIIEYTSASQWIKQRTKLLYLLSAICGSSFSAIALCNSYLLQLSVFSMALSQYHQRLFARKRFFSIILFENIPQLIIQIIALVLAIVENKVDSTLLVTVLSMVFTIISIFASIFEYLLGLQFEKSSSVIVFRFSIESAFMANMKHDEFKQQFMFKYRKLSSNIAKLLHLNYSQIERLMPLHDSNGAIFTIIIDSDSGNFDNIKNTAIKCVDNEKFAKAFEKSFKIQNFSRKQFSISQSGLHFELHSLGKSFSRSSSQLSSAVAMESIMSSPSSDSTGLSPTVSSMHLTNVDFSGLNSNNSSNENNKRNTISQL